MERETRNILINYMYLLKELESENTDKNRLGFRKEQVLERIKIGLERELQDLEYKKKEIENCFEIIELIKKETDIQM